MNPIHRDDLPPEILDHLEKEFAGIKIVCAGDAPEGTLPPEVLEHMKKLADHHNQSIIFGTCLDCGALMPNYPKAGEEDFPDGWEPAEGWTMLLNISDDEPVAWVCPACDAEDEP